MAPAFTSKERLCIVLTAGLIPIVFALAAIFVILTRGGLPESVPIHWGPGGTPDAYGPPAVLIATFSSISIVFGIIIAATVANAPAQRHKSWQLRFLVAMSVALAAFLTTALGGTIIVDEASNPGLPMLAGLGAALVFGFIAWLGTPNPAVAAPDTVKEAKATALASDERVLWVQTASPSRGAVWSLTGALVLVAAAAVLVAVIAENSAYFVPVAAGLIVLAVFTTLYWTIRVDADGVIARGVLGIPKFHVPLTDIAGASVVEVSAIGEYGGWGIRLGRGKPAIILRSGEALEVRRTDGSVFVVTVDDAAAAASLINGLVLRHAQTVQP